MVYSCTNERLITFRGDTLSCVAEAALPQWFRRLRAEEDVLTELNGVAYPHALLAEVWQSPYGGADKTVDVHLSWLRRKLGETAAEPRLLHSVRGVGVKLVEPG